MKWYGYCRISTPQQNIERQIRNIKKLYPEATIIEEAYTGTKLDGREAMGKLLKQARPGDAIVFDSVSRMSRNAEEGYTLYQELFNQEIDLIFLKEPHINTQTYKQAVKNCIDIEINTGDNKADNLFNTIISALNAYQMELIKEQIRLAFEQSEKEVQDLRQRTKEGIETARLKGKQIGQEAGRTLNIKKKNPAKEQILEYSKDFNGTLKDADVIKLVNLSRNTYYKYKRELKDGQ